MELDVNSILNTLIAGGAIYAGIRVEIRFLWRDVGRLEERFKKFKDEVIASKNSP